MANVAQSVGLTAFLREDDRAGEFLTTLNANARLVVLARAAADTGSIAADWAPLPPDRSSGKAMPRLERRGELLNGGYLHSFFF